VRIPGEGKERGGQLSSELSVCSVANSTWIMNVCGAWKEKGQSSDCPSVISRGWWLWCVLRTNPLTREPIANAFGKSSSTGYMWCMEGKQRLSLCRLQGVVVVVCP
jgi:hypothetical protein